MDAGNMCHCPLFKARQRLLFRHLNGGAGGGRSQRLQRKADQCFLPMPLCPPNLRKEGGHDTRKGLERETALGGGGRRGWIGGGRWMLEGGDSC